MEGLARKREDLFENFSVINLEEGPQDSDSDEGAGTDFYLRGACRLSLVRKRQWHKLPLYGIVWRLRLEEAGPFLLWWELDWLLGVDTS